VSKKYDDLRVKKTNCVRAQARARGVSSSRTSRARPARRRRERRRRTRVAFRRSRAANARPPRIDRSIVPSRGAKAMAARIPDAIGGKGEETRRRLALSEAVVERLETAVADKSRALDESIERERALEATIAELRAAPSRDARLTEMREKVEAMTRETESLRASTLALASTRAPSDPEEDAALAVRVANAEGSLASSRARLDVAEAALAEWRLHAEALTTRVRDAESGASHLVTHRLVPTRPRPISVHAVPRGRHHPAGASLRRAGPSLSSIPDARASTPRDWFRPRLTALARHPSAPTSPLARTLPASSVSHRSPYDRVGDVHVDP
jgi:hypothetical protein